MLLLRVLNGVLYPIKMEDTMQSCCANSLYCKFCVYTYLCNMRTLLFRDSTVKYKQISPTYKLSK